MTERDDTDFDDLARKKWLHSSCQPGRLGRLGSGQIDLHSTRLGSPAASRCPSICKEDVFRWNNLSSKADRNPSGRGNAFERAGHLAEDC